MDVDFTHLVGLDTGYGCLPSLENLVWSRGPNKKLSEWTKHPTLTILIIGWHRTLSRHQASVSTLQKRDTLMLLRVGGAHLYVYLCGKH